jgi:hypothetical protein
MSKSWIGRFENKRPDEIVCPGFWRLRHLARCPFNCEFCFVSTTFSRFGFPKPITEADLPDMEQAVEKWMKKNSSCPLCHETDGFVDSGEAAPYEVECLHCHQVFWSSIMPKPLVLNAGELSDSFSPEISAKASLRLIELFRKQQRHTLLLLTKSSRVAEILKDIEPTKQVILSFSFGQSNFDGKDISPYWPTPIMFDDLEHWRIRLRFDPIIDGIIAVKTAALAVHPERITLGCLRANAAHYRYLNNGNDVQRSLAALLVKDPNGGSHPYRLPLDQRVEIYARAMQDLKGLAPEIGICKETKEVFEKLGLKPGDNKCNCLP